MAALRPTELQVILTATRDIEKVQSITQQHSRLQQEQLALQFQQEIEQRKRKTQASDKAEQGKVNVVEDASENEKKSAKKRRQQNDSAATDSGHEENSQSQNDQHHIIDILI